MQYSAVSELEYRLKIPPQFLEERHRNNPVAVAHSVLQALRDSGDEQCLFLRAILQLQQQGLAPEKEEIFFHCVTGCRQVVLWQWKHYSGSFLRALRNYFLALGHSLASLGTPTSRTCRLACYTSSVAFWKRGWNQSLSDHPAVKAQEESLMQDMLLLGAPTLHDEADLLRYVEALFPEHSEKAASFCSGLVGEFNGKSSVSYRLPLEFHKETHRAFEKTALFPILQWSMAALSRIVNEISSSSSPSLELQKEAQAVVVLAMDVIGWEFGLGAFDPALFGASAINRVLIRPPVEWRDVLIQPVFVGAVFHIHHIIAALSGHLASELAHDLRLLLLHLASLSGPMFKQPSDRTHFASHMLQGTFVLLERSIMMSAMEEKSDLLDALQLFSRLVANFRLATLIELPTLVPILQGVTATATKILEDQACDCEQAGGDIEGMEYREWREEALAILLECAVLLCGDPWLLYSGSEESRRNAQLSLSVVLGPLYESFVRCRLRTAKMEEHYVVNNDADLDEVKEDILDAELAEEMASVATVGRLNLFVSISCLSQFFGHTMPRLQSLWDGTGEVTPDTAALLEESRLLTMYVSHLLTDNNEGESPAIPDAVVVGCRESAGLTGEIAAAVQALLKFADSQVQKIVRSPSNRRLSPLLAKSFLWFLRRWVPAYLYPSDVTSSHHANPIFQQWSTVDKAQEVISFSVSLCLHYQCYWPHEQNVQENASALVMAIARRGGRVRSALVASEPFQSMVRFHCLTADIRHASSQDEFEAVVRSKRNASSPPSPEMIWGYHRLSYKDRAAILASILVACSDRDNDMADTMLMEALQSVHDSVMSLINAITSQRIDADDVNAKEMTSLCVEMLCGVVHASEMSDPDRIPQFVTPYLRQLASLMTFYAKDLSICEALLRFFRDYTEQFVAVLDHQQSLMLFHACAELLKSYSAAHCASRVVVERKSAGEAEADEEKAYNDILCAIQLLINLGTKDFIVACSTGEGIESAQVTDMVFFGLQQILPLMSQGLMHYPLLSSQFFELVGYMMDIYAEKVCVLPFELVDALMEALLFGMSHHDPNVAKNSLNGIAALAKEHIQTKALSNYLSRNPDLFDIISKRLLTEVVFQNVVLDRLEASGYALLPLAAVDLNRFAAVVQDLSNQVPDDQQRVRLQAAFQKLIKPEALAKVAEGGYEGRLNRVHFKKDFEEFVHEVHSFLVLR